MGIMDFVKGGVREMMIARPDNVKHLIVYKHPDETIPMWSQLTVDSDEGAVFFRDGRVFGIIGPGRHTLDSQNIPFLGQLVDRFTGGNVFKAEVFFVRTQPNRNDPVKFGGRLDGMIDPGTEMPCTPRVFGEMVVRVMDPVKFIVGLTGQAIQPNDNQLILEWCGKRFMIGAEQAIADVCQTEMTSVLEISGKKRALEQRFIQSCPSFEEVGVQLVEMVNFKITLDDKERAELTEVWKETKVMLRKKRAELEARKMEIGVDVAERQAYVGMANDPAYMQYAQAEALLKAGEGMAKGGGAGVAGLGAQMAVGVGMAGMFQQGFHQPRPAPRVHVAPGATVACTSCGAQNPGGKFCANCGQPLAPPAPQPSFCSNCGQPTSGKFCANCGASAGGPPPQAGGAPPAGGGGGGGVAHAAPPQGQHAAGYAPPGAQAAPAGYPPAQQGGYPPPAGHYAPPQGYPPAPQGYAAPPGAPPQGGGYPPAGYPPPPGGGGRPPGHQGG
jgi:membrane protease subunit (stomatin/prohibitin family)